MKYPIIFDNVVRLDASKDLLITMKLLIDLGALQINIWVKYFKKIDIFLISF